MNPEVFQAHLDDVRLNCLRIAARRAGRIMPVSYSARSLRGRSLKEAWFEINVDQPKNSERPVANSPPNPLPLPVSNALTASESNSLERTGAQSRVQSPGAGSVPQKHDSPISAGASRQSGFRSVVSAFFRRLGFG